MNMIKTTLAIALIAGTTSAMAAEITSTATLALKEQVKAVAVEKAQPAVAKAQDPILKAENAKKAALAKAEATQKAKADAMKKAEALKNAPVDVKKAAETKVATAKTEVKNTAQAKTATAKAEMQEKCKIACEEKKVVVKQVADKAEKKGFFSWFKKSA